MFLSVDHLPVILSLPKISNSFLGMLLKAQSFTDESLEIFLYFLMFLEADHISHLLIKLENSNPGLAMAQEVPRGPLVRDTLRLRCRVLPRCPHPSPVFPPSDSYS